MTKSIWWPQEKVVVQRPQTWSTSRILRYASSSFCPTSHGIHSKKNTSLIFINVKWIKMWSSWRRSTWKLGRLDEGPNGRTRPGGNRKKVTELKTGPVVWHISISDYCSIEKIAIVPPLMTNLARKALQRLRGKPRRKTAITSYRMKRQVLQWLVRVIEVSTCWSSDLEQSEERQEIYKPMWDNDLDLVMINSYGLESHGFERINIVELRQFSEICVSGYFAKVLSLL